jgi:SAM-dependent methyltransferase
MQIIGWIIVFLIFIGCLSFISYLVVVMFGVVAGAPFIPSDKKTLKRMLEVIDIKPGTVTYDLGSGDGRFVFELAKLGADSRGIEISPFVYCYARIRQFIFSAGGKLIRANVYNVDLSEADIIFTYLLPKMMDKIEPKLIRELKPGTLLVSHGFKFSNRQPIKSFSRQNGLGSVYIYQF